VAAAGARDEVPIDAEVPAATSGPEPAGNVAAGEASGGVILGTYRDLWATEVTDRSPALRFLAPKQALEVAPADAERLGVRSGDEVDVRSNGTGVRARVSIHERIRPGSGFLIDGLGDGARALRGELVEISRAGDTE
jgi:anaerobic selenocysteine-containing dehydrogenase